MRRVNVVLAAVLLASCGGGGGHGFFVGSSTAPISSTTPASSLPPAPGLEVVPTIVVHGITGDPDNFFQLFADLAVGRTVIPEMYLDEADALQPNSLPPDVVVAFGYYKTHIGGPRYDDHGSIGGCPVARTDGMDAWYTISYADRLRHCVEGVKRATGASKVDLVLHSMGGLVGRAYTHWLSVDPTGASSVRRVFLFASPSRGINALECVGLAVAYVGSQEFMRQGECMELCEEATTWGGSSFVDLMNQDWDAFCAQKGIAYAGLTATGAQGGPGGGSSGNLIPNNSLPMAQIQQFLTGLLQWGTLGALVPIIMESIANLPNELQVAMGLSDGTVRLASSRLDGPPFLATIFWTTFEGNHANNIDPEQVCVNSTYSADCVRAFCIEGKAPLGSATCTGIAVSRRDAPGRASWIQVDVTIAGVVSDSSPLGLQLVEETLDASGNATSVMGYGARLRNGGQSLQFAVPAGGGTRRYRAVAYGERGEIGVASNVVFQLTDGAVDPSPAATIQATPGASSAHLVFSANGPSPLYSVRFDRGDWQPWTETATFDTPPLLPGVHRVEVRCQHAGNGAGVQVECLVPAAVGIRVDATGNVTVVP
ncbi:MAG TPA: hypothetical protein VFF73_20150 [Planctomycetota bacterium]|nr:hypothetical protein [Planctomycetota bacterium]